jgi:hypothetical protein
MTKKGLRKQAQLKLGLSQRIENIATYKKQAELLDGLTHGNQS